jgi:L-asparaginase
MGKPKIAVFSGPTATVQNSEPLITSNKARQKYGLPLMTNPDGSPIRFDAVRPQRLAAPVTVYVEQFSAHPLEVDAAELYGAPDGFLDAAGGFHKERQSDADRPVYEVVLQPDDGLYWLPFMGRQADGSAWESECAFPLAPAAQCRQTFYPDASRILEEIDRIGLDNEGRSNILSSKANFAFYRAAPSGGYKKGLPAGKRTDTGEGDIAPETMNEDFWAYRPTHLRGEPQMAAAARLANVVQKAMATGEYAGAIWLEGSPSVDETTYWLNLLIDTTVPICGNSSQRPHGALSNDGDRNIVDSVDYIVSGIWKDENGKDTVGGVLIVDEMIFASRDVHKADARPGGYVATGGHGGICGSIGQPGPPVLTYRPARVHTYRSDVRISQLPATVDGVHGTGGKIETVPVQVKSASGDLLPEAIPTVTFLKTGRYQPSSSSSEAASEVDVLARIEQNLREAPLAGFVAEGSAPFGSLTPAIEAALLHGLCSGMPFVKVGRGNAEGMVPRNPPYLYISGSNMTANKARLLLMAAMMKLGALPPAADPATPTPDELAAIKAKLDLYQAIFDTH